jgi:hypothetical protein
MNIKQLKEYIKDLPDDIEIWIYDSDNSCDRLATELAIDTGSVMTINLSEWKEYLSIR